MKYEYAQDLQERMEEMIRLLEMNHIDPQRVKCFRSFGSSTKRTIARCHTIGKLMQKAIGVKAHYAIEFLEKFGRMSREEQDKTIIHELMHIPKTFGGGFRNHDYVCERNVDIMHERFISLKSKRTEDPRSRFEASRFANTNLDGAQEPNVEKVLDRDDPFNWRKEKDPRRVEGKPAKITNLGKGTLRFFGL